MSNPAPRPALRKAPDADLHPAEADKSRQAVVIDLAERSIELPDTPRASPTRHSPSMAPTRPRRSAHVGDKGTLVPDQTHTVDEPSEAKSKKNIKAQRKSDKKARTVAAGATKVPEGKNKRKVKKAKKGKGKKTPKQPKQVISDPRIALKSNISRKARQDLRAGAKARGTSLDSAVDSVVTDLRNR